MPEPEPKSTRPPQSPVSTVFRESFITMFERPEDEAALRRIGALVHDLAWEGRDLIEAKEGSSTWRVSIRGAVGDLRQAADQLAEMARDLDEAGGGGREAVRVVLAIADALREVEPIAARLDAALAVYLVAETEE